MRHPGRPEIAGAVAGQHLVPHSHVLDRLRRAIGQRDRRACDEALIVVSDYRQVPVAVVAAGEELEEAVLGVVGVLVLVDEDVAEGGGVAGADLREELEDVDGPHEQVVEVHRVHAVQVALVQLEDVRDGLLEEGADELPVGLGVAQLVLRIGDLVVQRSWGEPLRVDAQLVDAALDEAAGVGLVVDREAARVAKARRLVAQDPRAGGVEGHHPHRAGAPAEERLDPLAHLLRGLVRERDREDLPGAGEPGVHKPGDPVGEHARLAGARAREDEQRPVAVRHRLALGRVETLEEGLDTVVGGRLWHLP